MEGIFRLAGSEKRIKELKVQFDSPDRYGKGLDWTGYTVHDAANILRRYFNQLPEPIIPLSFYERFRDPLRNHQAEAVGELEAQSPSVGHFDHEAAITQYQRLMTELPPLNRQLLLYILDLLAVFASKSDLNKMTTANLSAIFQPGILSHPNHDMAPQEYRLSQDVLIFLIDNQDNFLIGMHGTAADPETVKDVQSGPLTPSKAPSTPTTPGRSKTIIGRSTSNASAGAESMRKFGSLRRNVSVSSSKRSKQSENGPTAVPGQTTPTTSGVHRSISLPSRRGGSNGASPRFSRENKHSDPTTPSPGNTSAVAVEVSRPKQESLQSTPVATTAPQFPAEPNVTSASSSEATTPLAPVGSEASSPLAREYQTPKKDTTPLLSPPGGDTYQRSPSHPPSATSGKGLLDIFKQSPPREGEGKPKKLQKKRIPGSSLSSAQSSNQSLPNEEQKSPSSAATAPEAVPYTTGYRSGDRSEYATAQGTPDMQAAARESTGATLRPTVSPTHSYHSNTDLSDADLVGDDAPREQTTEPEKEKKRHRWRFSRSQNKFEGGASPQASANPLGTMTAREQTTSRSTVGSTGQPRRSFQEPTPLTPAATDPNAGAPLGTSVFGSPPTSNTDPAVFSDSERERKAGPMSWIRGKIQERKDKDAEKRTRTPERNRETRESRQDLPLPADALPVRGKSFEQARSSQSQAQPSVAPGAVAAAQLAAGVSPASSGAVAETSPEGAGPTISLPTSTAPVDTNGEKASTPEATVVGPEQNVVGTEQQGVPSEQNEEGTEQNVERAEKEIPGGWV